MSTRTRLRALAIAATCSLAAVLGVALPSQQAPAQAADLRAFDAGYIIGDALFYDSGAMTAAAIQSFLTVKGSSCVATTGNTCLKAFRQTTWTRAADTLCTRTYTGATNETAAQIIAKVAVSCRINPQVLLVMLQKEQSLVASTLGGSATAYRSAMGYGCPDTALCNTKYYGFFNQVYSAAHQFQYYAKNPTKYPHRVGIVNQIAYYPMNLRPECGKSGVYIQNQATASLYNYTPYQPNAAALAAGSGTGDRCSAYGNRNFWIFFTDWFGPTTQRQPIGRLEALRPTSPDVISVRGWALDPDTTASINVHVYVDGRVAVGLAATGSRPDVGRSYRRGDNHGFSGAFKSTSGTHQVCVYAIDSAGGTNPRIGCASVTVINHAPIGALDSVRSTAGHISVSGWALDPDTTASIAVHVYVDGRLAAGLTAAGSRPDIGRIFGKGVNHGFGGTVNATSGTHQVCAYAIDTTRGTNPRVGCKTITVINHRPIGALDSVTSTAGHISTRGWALDPDTTSPIIVHVYVDGRATQALTANTPRPDIGRIFGKGDNHGFGGTVNATKGTHQVCVYAIDASGGINPRIKCQSVTVP
jgi:hypothetical protein